MIRWIVFAMTLLSTTLVYAGETVEINTILMRSTFKLTGENSTGTAFILGKPAKGDKDLAYFVLVTAAHVLEKMKGDKAKLILRKRLGDFFAKVPHPIQIRRGITPLWIQHPTVDVAVMYVSLPRDIDVQMIPTDLLATDDILKQLEIHPGDRLSCLGFPLEAEANEAGFAILRSGQIASFPLVPIKSVKTFLFGVFSLSSG